MEAAYDSLHLSQMDTLIVDYHAEDDVPNLSFFLFTDCVVLLYIQMWPLIPSGRNGVFVISAS